jgi:hypothetical protein
VSTPRERATVGSRNGRRLRWQKRSAYGQRERPWLAMRTTGALLLGNKRGTAVYLRAQHEVRNPPPQVALKKEMDLEPREIEASYEVVRRRVEPVGMVYLVAGTR